MAYFNALLITLGIAVVILTLHYIWEGRKYGK